MAKQDLQLDDETLKRPEMVNKFWNKFKTAHPVTISQYSVEALKWFRTIVSKSLHLRADRILQDTGDYKTKAKTPKDGFIGRLYLFEYKAEEAGHAATGTYDKYPVVFFFNLVKSEQGKWLLYGLNMHYLSPTQRLVMFQELLRLKTTKGITERTKLKLQWDLIKSVGGSGLHEKAVHAYRLDRIRSKMVQIPANDWPIAIFLQIQQFVKVDDHSTPNQSTIRKSVYAKPKKPRL